MPSGLSMFFCWTNGTQCALMIVLAEVVRWILPAIPYVRVHFQFKYSGFDTVSSGPSCCGSLNSNARLVLSCLVALCSLSSDHVNLLLRTQNGWRCTWTSARSWVSLGRLLCHPLSTITRGCLRSCPGRRRFCAWLEPWIPQMFGLILVRWWHELGLVFPNCPRQSPQELTFSISS